MEDICALTIPKEMNCLCTQHWKNTTRETLRDQSSPSLSGEGKVEESHMVCDAADKSEISMKILTKQAAYKLYAANMPIKNYETVRMRSGEII